MLPLLLKGQKPLDFVGSPRVGTRSVNQNRSASSRRNTDLVKTCPSLYTMECWRIVEVDGDIRAIHLKGM
jgi:hypothetical protein